MFWGKREKTKENWPLKYVICKKIMFMRSLTNATLFYINIAIEY